MPKSSLSFVQAAIAPGTLTAWGVSTSIFSTPFSINVAALAAAGDLPEPFKAIGLEEVEGLYKTNQSPPIPVMAG